MFVNAYPHVQTLEDVYLYALNTSNNKALQRRIKDGEVYEPVSYKFLLLMAWLTKQKHYEQIKADMMEEWIDWRVKRYENRVKSFVEGEEAIVKRDPSYKKLLVHERRFYIRGDVRAVMRKRIQKYIAKVESKQPDEVLR